MRLDSQPVPDGRVVVQQAGDVQVLLSLDSGCYYTLDEVGGTVWRLCDGRPVSEIVAQMCVEYDAPPAQIQSDVLELLAALKAERLLDVGA
jgi:hypothetical protein